jgi:predicted O-methyltransferase YrrM
MEYTEEELEKVSGRDLVPLIKAYSEGKQKITGIEIGVQEGPTSVWFLQHLPNLTLYGIDPYEAYQDWYPGGFMRQELQDKLRMKMLSRMVDYPDRFVHLRKTSDDAADFFKDKSVDFIFIDGLHTYDQVLKDCRNYYPKIKKGGIFAGHDFKAIEGVRNAVLYFAKEIGVEEVKILPDNDVWYWIK